MILSLVILTCHFRIVKWPDQYNRMVFPGSQKNVGQKCGYTTMLYYVIPCFTMLYEKPLNIRIPEWPISLFWTLCIYLKKNKRVSIPCDYLALCGVSEHVLPRYDWWWEQETSTNWHLWPSNQILGAPVGDREKNWSYTSTGTSVFFWRSHQLVKRTSVWNFDLKIHSQKKKHSTYQEAFPKGNSSSNPGVSGAMLVSGKVNLQDSHKRLTFAYQLS